MNTLYVIGNGFDIAHGLKTRYISFLNYLEKSNLNVNGCLVDIFGIRYPGCIDRLTEEEQEKLINDCFWKDFESNLGKPDIESIRSTIDNVYNDLDGIEDSYNHAEEVIKSHFSIIYNLQKEFENWIKSIDTNVKKKMKLKFDETDYILSFNYTDTLEKNYNVDSRNIIHIHGMASKGDELIFGHEDGTLIEYEDQLENFDEEYYDNDSLLYSSEESYIDPIDGAEEIYNFTIKDVDEIIKSNRLFFFDLSEIEKVVFIGFSFGAVDVPYVNKIKESISKNAKYIIYYYSQADYDEKKNISNKLGLNAKLRNIEELWEKDENIQRKKH